MSEKYLGAVVSPADNRDYQAKDYIAAGVRPAEYYPKVLCPVHHQEAGDCTAWALATAKFYHELRERKSQYEFAPVFSFFDRTDDDYTGEGRYMRKVLDNARKNGICYAKDLPKGVPLSADYPNEEISAKLAPLFPKAKENRIAAYAYTTKTDEIADCVFQHGAATITIDVRVSFDAFVLKDDSNWVLPMPKDGERVRGCHEVCAVGFTKDGIIIQNSWGTPWGYNGFAVLPWGYPILEGWPLVDEVKRWDIIELIVGENKAFVNDKEIAIDATVMIKGGRTFVPLRFIGEALGAKVFWKNGTRTITIKDKDNVITMQIGERIGYANNYAYVLDEAPFIKNDRTFVPLRFIGEALGADVEWIASERKIVVRRVRA